LRGLPDSAVGTQFFAKMKVRRIGQQLVDLVQQQLWGDALAVVARGPGQSSSEPTPGREATVQASADGCGPGATAIGGAGGRPARRCNVSRASAIWNAIDPPWRTILAPIATSRSRSVVVDHCFTSAGRAMVRGKLARL
jgi:hypothetical protein